MVTHMMTKDGGDTIEGLQKLYCPPLDEALFFAIASDYDSADRDSINALKSALESLREGAVIEQELELLPEPESGNGNRNHTSEPDDAGKTQPDVNSFKPSQSSHQSETDEGVESATTGITTLAFSEDGTDEHDFMALGYGDAGEAFDCLSENKKVEWLMNMFPSVAAADVKTTFAKCHGGFDKTADELLNLSFLNESGQNDAANVLPVVKGIDGFMANSDTGHTGRKRRAKNKRRQNRADHDDSTSPWMSDSGMSSGPDTPSSTSSNIWTGASKDTDFIATRTTLKPKLIASVYHANSARLAPTIRALVTKEGETYLRSNGTIEDLMQWQIDELKIDFERVPDFQIYGAIMLANKIPSAAKELLDVMITSKEEPVMLGKVRGLASYAPVDLSEDEDIKRHFSTPWSGAQPIGTGVYTTSHMANSHGVAASQAFQQASAAYKRGKSDHLMGGAAAYYASVGHERSKAAKSLQAAAADAHVARQSSSTGLDLHGVNVADAVRIARQGTEAWWDGLGDRKYVPVGGIGGGYRIVTGVGRHSSDGIGRIGPAVSKMLVREGWKVQVETGELVVLGRVRKR